MTSISKRQQAPNSERPHIVQPAGARRTTQEQARLGSTSRTRILQRESTEPLEYPFSVGHD